MSQPLASNRVFVGGISWKANEESLQNFFSSFGEVVECKIIMDKITGKSKGYGFVTFQETESADKVKEAGSLHFLGKDMNVGDAVRRMDMSGGGRRQQRTHHHQRGGRGGHQGQGQGQGGDGDDQGQMHGQYPGQEFYGYNAYPPNFYPGQQFYGMNPYYGGPVVYMQEGPQGWQPIVGGDQILGDGPQGHTLPTHMKGPSPNQTPDEQAQTNYLLQQLQMLQTQQPSIHHDIPQVTHHGMTAWQLENSLNALQPAIDTPGSKKSADNTE